MAQANPFSPCAVGGHRLSKAAAWIVSVVLWVFFGFYCIFSLIQVMHDLAVTSIGFCSNLEGMGHACHRTLHQSVLHVEVQC